MADREVQEDKRSPEARKGTAAEEFLKLGRGSAAVDVELLRDAEALNQRMAELGMSSPGYSIAPALGGDLTRTLRTESPKPSTAFKKPGR